MTDTGGQWPAIPLSDWQDTCTSLHLWSQVVGKIRLAQMPWINHSWHIPLYVTARGLDTSLVPHAAGAFGIEFDFVDHRLRVTRAGGEPASFALEPMSTAEFYRRLLETLDTLGLPVRIWPSPVEIPDPIRRFPDDDAPGAYDAEAVGRYWRALLQVQRVFTAFRARFIGKVSPVHFFWGAFDLAVTRFSGRPAPTHPGGAPNCADWVMVEAYSHEVSSAGFWPGVGLGEAAFYAYAYPQPAGFAEYPVRPRVAYFHPELGEFVLPYEAVRTADAPDAVLLEFLQTTYEAAADLAGWDRAALERQLPHGP